ncbi:hypothetical protein AcV5_000485 [Taiwanofungus camphoratus]|nr:hypothetical protein AcV5_000485 [Antrodia cinnamomea]
MARRALHFLLAFVPTVALAFQNTHPLVAWSSHSSDALTSASLSKSTHPTTLLETLLLNDDVCQHDAVILVDQIDLHASDLRTLSSSSALAESLSSSPSSLQLPYIRRSTSHPFSNLAATLAQRCGSRVVSVVPGQNNIQGAQEKHVVCMGMSSLDGIEGMERKSLMAALESRLSSSLSELAISFPSYLVVYAGWHPSHHARQFDPNFSSSFSNSNYTSTSALSPPTGGILARYQLLTPGLIISLLIGFFVLIPIVLMGVSAVASIKSPLQGEPPKGFIAAEKKNQ